MANSSPNIAYETKGKVEGIWLLDQQALKELDSVLDDAQKNLESQRKTDIENDVERRLRRDDRLRSLRDPTSKEPTGDEKKQLKKNMRQEIEQSYPYSNENRELTIFCSPGRDFKVQRFSEALGKPEVEHVIPIGFQAEIKCGNAQLTMTLNQFSHTEIEISVIPHATGTSSDIFTSLQAWAEGKRQPTWQLFWKRVSGLQWVLFSIHIMIVLIVYSAILGVSMKQPNIAEARQLLQKGMTKEDDHKAIELLLAIVSDYQRPTNATPYLPLPPRWLTISLIFSLLACIALSFPVDTTIGIGKGKRILARRRFWLSSLYFVFILFFLLAIGGSFLSNVLYDYVTK